MSKSPQASKVLMTQLVMPEHANVLGNIFGGQLMAWIDQAAAICAFRHARKLCVTASIDAVDFISPVRIGDIVILEANLNYTGRTSMEVGVMVTAENPLTGEKNKTTTAYLTFVALDEAGKPSQVPEIVPETAEEKKWFVDAEQRRKLRLEKKKNGSK